MTFEQIQGLVDEHLEMILSESRSPYEAQDKARKFLVIQSLLASYFKDVEEQFIKLQTVQDAMYSQSIRCIDGKNITEKKVFVSEDPAYVKSREELETQDALKNWVKTHIKIFENAHLSFRQESKERP